MSRPPAAVKPYTPSPKAGTPRSVACPRCLAGVGFACRQVRVGLNLGDILTYHHLERRKAARGE